MTEFILSSKNDSWRISNCVGRSFLSRLTISGPICRLKFTTFARSFKWYHLFQLSSFVRNNNSYANHIVGLSGDNFHAMRSELVFTCLIILHSFICIYFYFMRSFRKRADISCERFIENYKFRFDENCS